MIVDQTQIDVKDYELRFSVDQRIRKTGSSEIIGKLVD